MRNYEPLPKIPWFAGWNASRSSLLPATSSLIPELQKCLRIRAHDKDVQVWKSKNHKTASYGVCKPAAVCGCALCVGPRWLNAVGVRYSKPWLCIAPVAAKCIFDLTVPHTRFDALEGLLERQGKALQGFLRDRKVKEVFKEMGYIGQIRGYETTHGRKGTNNGWHPHFHFLQFVMVM